MAGSVQFVGKDQVMAAFESREVEAWGIFQHKQFIHKGYSSEDLSAFLDMLLEGGTNATYTMKVYEGMKDASGIKEKTECDGSYNFKINVPGEGIAGAGYMNNQGNAQILKRLTEIEEKLQGDDQPEIDEPETIGSVIIDVIKDPNKALQWANIIKDIFNPPAPGTAAPVQRHIAEIIQPAAMGNTNTAATNLTEDEKENRIIAVMGILEAQDPYLLFHLEKLASIAQKKPAAFKNLLSMLELL